MFSTRWFAAVVALTVVFGLPTPVRGQVEIDNNFKYNSGQDIQPVFEGWSHAPDGGFFMHFGYLNRNWVQELSIPVGPANDVEPGGPDRGQPTYFYPRTQRNLFTVKVPKDWGKNEVTWTVTANGKTQKAIGWLQAEWEIDPAGGASFGGRTDGEYVRNKPPALTFTETASASVSTPLVLRIDFADDGLPSKAAKKRAAIATENPPTLRGSAELPVNVPQLNSAAGAARVRGVQDPSVTWIVWRGPAGASIAPRTALVKDGHTETTLTFSKPGEYVLRARATDGVLWTARDLTVTVK